MSHKESDLNWEYLKTLCCPKCSQDLGKDGEMLFCFDCGFKVTIERAREIVIEMTDRKRDYFGRAEFEELMENL